MKIKFILENIEPPILNNIIRQLEYTKNSGFFRNKQIHQKIISDVITYMRANRNAVSYNYVLHGAELAGLKDARQFATFILDVINQASH